VALVVVGAGGLLALRYYKEQRNGNFTIVNAEAKAKVNANVSNTNNNQQANTETKQTENKNQNSNININNKSKATERIVWIGVDGGGSKTVAICMDQSKQVVGRGRSASTNQNSVGPDKAAENLRQAITLALQQADCTPTQVVGVCVGMSGVDRPQDKETVKRWVEPILPRVPLRIENDAVIALASGTEGRLFGVVVISGTGTIAFGFDKTGKSQRASGWGPLLGDEGSGYQIGYEVLRAVARAVDQRGPDTMLVDALLQKLQLLDPQQLIPWTYRDISWERFAQLAPIAFECARKGDKVAQAIIDHQAEQLVVSVEAVARRLQLSSQSFPLVLAGGNLTHEGSDLARLFKEKASRRLPTAQVIKPTLDAESAAAVLAMNTFPASQQSNKK
jgi:N-acetylglucosamine kinase-like BadF-type ATPase